MDLLGTVMSPVMGLFGLPGEAFAVLISAFFAKASRLCNRGIHVSGWNPDAWSGLHDAACLYPDGYADWPLCAYRFW